MFNLERIANGLDKQGFNKGAGKVQNLAHSLQKEGLIPNSLNKSEKTYISTLLRDYRSQLKNPEPEIITTTWQELWRIWGQEMNMTINVFPCCNWLKEEIRKPFVGIDDKPQKKTNAMMIYFPPELAGKNELLEKILPKMVGSNVNEDSLNDCIFWGWLKVDLSKDSPNRNTTENQLREFLASQGRVSQGKEHYRIASNFQKLLTKHPYDEWHSWSRLLEMTTKDGCVAVNSENNGQIKARSVPRKFSYWNLGGYSLQTLDMVRK